MLSSSSHVPAAYHRHYTSPETMVIVISTCFGLSITTVILRFISRFSLKSRIFLDDWLVLAALFFTGGFIGSILYSLIDIQQAFVHFRGIDTQLNRKLAYTAEVLYYTIQACLKLSILHFYWRLFKSTKLRHWILGFTLIALLWSGAAIITTVVQCIPISAAWGVDSGRASKCIDLSAFFLGVSIPHIIIDVSLIIMPLPHIWSLMIPKEKKLPVIILFLLGAFVMVASCTRLYYLVHFDAITFRFYWSNDKSVLWSAMEHCFGIIGISLPSLRPLFRALYSRVKSVTSTTTAASSALPGCIETPPQPLPRPRMGSVEYWARLQFQSLTTTRRASSAVVEEVHEEVPRRSSRAKRSSEPSSSSQHVHENENNEVT